MTVSGRHFLDISEIPAPQLQAIIADSRRRKDARTGHPRGLIEADTPLSGRVLAMIFEKPSTRTRVSFDVAMRQMGGGTLMLSAAEMQLGRGETIADTAQVLSRYVDGIMIRTTSHAILLELARHATVPVINGLTDLSHPCQVMADLLTFEEKKGPIAGKTVAWVGDSCNMTNSWIHAAGRFGFEMRVASPKSLQPSAEVQGWARANTVKLAVTEDPYEAVKGADCVVTDTWVSMNVTDAGNRHHLLKAYQVDAKLMDHAGPDAIFMHCLPAHRGEEVTPDVMDGPRSVVFDETENRLHIQKGILSWCFGGTP